MARERLDRFELISELASGGMATVFLARLGGAGGFQRLYAIKRLHQHLANNLEFVEMFLDEARLAARIHHPNVVPILEIGTNANGYYLVMEYIEGDTAAHLFYCASSDGKSIATRVATRIALDALSGLHAAHELSGDDGTPLQIVHRDVSPHNLMVGADGVSRITDFGIAHAASRLSTTRSGQLKGKVAYMAPEQARSETVDRRADVFSMGICLWEMLAKRRLFKTDDDGETLTRLLYEPIPTLGSVAPHLPAALDVVCMKALARDPDARFASAAEFLDALESAAKSDDLIGTHREVAACVAEILGEDLAERRARVRASIPDGEGIRSIPPPAVTPVSDAPGTVSALAASIVGVVSPSAESTPNGTPPAQPHHAARRPAPLLVAAIATAGIAISAAAVAWSVDRARPDVATTPPAQLSMTPLAPSAPAISPSPGTALPAATNSRTAVDVPRSPPAPTAEATAAAVANPRPKAPPPKPRASSVPSAQPPPAVSVPADMLVNPYR